MNAMVKKFTKKTHKSYSVQTFILSIYLNVIIAVDQWWAQIKSRFDLNRFNHHFWDWLIWFDLIYNFQKFWWFDLIWFKILVIWFKSLKSFQIILIFLFMIKTLPSQIWNCAGTSFSLVIQHHIHINRYYYNYYSQLFCLKFLRTAF